MHKPQRFTASVKVGKKARICLSPVNSWRTKASVICASRQENDTTGTAVWGEGKGEQQLFQSQESPDSLWVWLSLETRAAAWHPALQRGCMWQGLMALDLWEKPRTVLEAKPLESLCLRACGSTRVDSSGKELIQEELAGVKPSKISGWTARQAMGELMTGCGQNHSSAAAQETCEVGGKALELHQCGKVTFPDCRVLTLQGPWAIPPSRLWPHVNVNLPVCKRKASLFSCECDTVLTRVQSLEQVALGLFIISFLPHAFPSSLPPFSGVWLVPGEGGIVTCKTAKLLTADSAEQGSHPRSLQQYHASHRACHNPQQNFPFQKLPATSKHS